MDLKRRRFLQLVGAASVAPALPAIPARMAVAGGTPAQMLWAGMAKNAGTAPKLAQLAQSMGVSSQASVGIYTKLAQANLVTMQTVANLARVPSAAQATEAVTMVRPVPNPRVKLDVVKFLTEDPEQGDEQSAREPNDALPDPSIPAETEQRTRDHSPTDDRE